MQKFEPTKFLQKINGLQEIPENTSQVTIETLIKIIVKSLPIAKYDKEDLESRYNHLVGMKLLTKL